MNWEKHIVELARVKPDTFGWLFELVCYPVLKELFGELESSGPLDFKVKGKDVFIEVKSQGFSFNERQIAFIIDRAPQVYVVLLESAFRPREQQLTKRIVHRFQTPLGSALIIELDLWRFSEYYRSEYEAYKARQERWTRWEDLKRIA